MQGLALLFVIIIWCLIAACIVKLIYFKMANTKIKRIASVLLFACIVPFPYYDEIIAFFQFSALCKDNALIYAEADLAGTGALRLLPGTRTSVPGKIVLMHTDLYIFADAITGREVMRFQEFHAESGWFMRALGMREDNVPFIFTGNCTPANQDVMQKVRARLIN